MIVIHGGGGGTFCILDLPEFVDCFQAVSDLEKGWTVGPKEAHAKLAELKQKGAKLEVKLLNVHM